MKKRKYKRLDDGGGIEDGIKSFYNQYANSPNYLKRLKGMGYNNPQEVIQARLNSINRAKIAITPGVGGSYNVNKHLITFDPEQSKEYPGMNKDVVIAHEYSHAAGSLGEYYIKNKGVGPLTLNKNEVNTLNSKNKFYGIDPFAGRNAGAAGEIIHDAISSELKADIDAFRYKLKKDNIYDTGTQEFNQQILNKVKPTYSKDPNFSRTFNRLSDKDLIYLMNNIAQGQNSSSDQAENGITMKIDKKNLLFSGLPTTRDLKKMMKAAQGATAGPGNPGDPRLKNMLSTLPDNYFDVFGKPQSADPNGIQRADTSGGMNPITAPNPNTYHPSFDPPPAPRQPNIGNAMLLGLEAFDAAIPGDRTDKQRVVRPQMGQAQYPQGTGSQAIMADGGGVGPGKGLWDTNRTGYVDSTLNANKNLDWVQRLYEKNTPSIQIPGQPHRSTHFMGDDGNGYVYPTVVRENGQLKYLGDKAEDYARDSNTGIQFPKEQGSWFAANGYKQGTGVLKEHEYGGYMMDLDRQNPIQIGEGDMADISNAKNGKWLQGAVNPKHKGYCTPMTKSTCTPRRKAFAKTMKKHHGFHKKEGGGIIPDPMSNFSPQEYAYGGTARGGSDTTNIFEQIAMHPNMSDMQGWDNARVGSSLRGGSDTMNIFEQIALHPNQADMAGWDQAAVGSTLRGGSDTMNIFEQIAQHPNMNDMKGWDKANSGKTLSKAKAKEILKDGTAQGHPITDKQRKYFGAVANGYADSGLPVGPGTPPPAPIQTPMGPGQVNPNADPGRHNAYLLDEMNYRLTHPTARKLTQGYNSQENQLLQDAFIYGRRTDQQGKTPQDVISSYFNRPTQQDPLGAMRQKLNNIGYGANAMYNSTPDITVADKKNYEDYPVANTFRNGGVMYDDGGQVETMWGGSVDQMSENPYDGGTMQFNGASHDDGGIGMHYNGNPVEVEGGETASRDSQGNLNIYGNMYLPGTRTKFKQVAKEMGKKEKRYDFLKNRGSELVNNSNPANKFDKLSFNAGRAMMEGGSVGQKDLAEKKENLAMLQRAMLDTADEYGIDAQHMSKGNIKKSSDKKQAKGGAYIPFAEAGVTTSGTPEDPNNPSRSRRNNNPGNIKYGKFAKAHGATGKDKGGFAIFGNKADGQSAMNKLLQTSKYQNMSVKDAIDTWTDHKPYTYNLPDIKDKKVSDLNLDEFNNLTTAMTNGEDTRYGTPRKPGKPSTPSQPAQPPTVTPKLPGLPDVPITPDSRPKRPGSVTPPPLTPLNYSPRQPLPSDAQGLGIGDVAPELFGIASNKTEPVGAQFYHPEQFTPYQVSFQDRINQNQSSYNALQRSIGATNPTALGAIAAQKYAADSGVKAEEFRTNQGISNDITNRNIALSNDAQLKNLAIADTQMGRQSQARSKTREYNQMILNSLSGKYAQNQLEQKRLKLYENLYDYRFVPTDQNGLQATYMGPDATFNYGRNQATASNNTDIKTVSRYDRNGNLVGSTRYDDSSTKDAKDALELEAQRRKLPLLTKPPL